MLLHSIITAPDFDIIVQRRVSILSEGSIARLYFWWRWLRPSPVIRLNLVEL